MKILNLLTFVSLVMLCLPVSAGTITIDASSMSYGGKYAGLIDSPFPGIALYGNGDYASKDVNFTEGNGVYTIKVTGASSNESAAGVSLYIGGTKIQSFSFSGKSASVQQSKNKLYFESQPVEVKLLLETDNGSNDTYINKVEFVYEKAIVDRPAPVLPSTGAYESGKYRNILLEAGYTQNEIDARLQMLWDSYFEGDTDTYRVYYETTDDEAYILDVNNDDVRSEGMSYGMMICVQLNKQKEFNKLWKWVKNHMQVKSGPAKGYFSWQVSKTGNVIGSSCAPDGDEYFAMALMFAAGRWGNGSGILNYWKEANEILYNSTSKDNYINSSHVNMFNEKEQQVVFVPYASSAKHTDPSYHLPAFYELWGEWADYNRPFWKSLAVKSREMYLKFANSTTGLMPDYANFDGTPTGSGHQEFRHDAWRNAMNIGTDYAWFAKSTNETTVINKLFDFFQKEGATSYGAEYSLAGKKLSNDHSPGLVGCNAAGTLASTHKVSWEILDDLMQASLTSGRYRYYDGMLFFLGFLHASGNYKIYKPAEVLEVAYDEQFRYTDNNTSLLIDDYEKIPAGYQYYMYMTDNSTAKAQVTANPTNASDHSLHITPGNYDEFYYLDYTLPEGRTLSDDYKQIEFDVYYNPSGDNHNQTLKVAINESSNVIYTESTGDRTTQGVWKHVVAPINGNYGNNVKILVSVRTRNADFYIDNLKLKCNYTPAPTPGPGPDPQPEDPSSTENMLSGDSYNFEGGTAGEWQVWGDNNPTHEVVAPGYNSSAYCLKLTNTTAGTDYYVAQAGLKLASPLVNGKTYKLKFKAKSSVEGGSIQFCYQNSETYDGSGYNTIELTTDWATYTYDVEVTLDNIDRILFNFGKVVGTYYIDEIEFGEESSTPDPQPEDPSNIDNMLSGDNYDFEGGTAGEWQVWGDNNPTHEVAAPGYNSSAYCLKLTNATAGTDYYVAQAGLKLESPLVNGKTYKLKFKAKSSVAGGSIQFCYQNSETYDGSGYNTIELTTDWATYTYDVDVTLDNIDRILFNFGKVVGTYYIDEIEFGEEGSTPAPTPMLKGDVNEDGVVDVADITAVANIILYNAKMDAEINE